MATTTEPPWKNLGTGTATRNGTTTHVIGHSTAATGPSSGGALSFVPTASALQVVFVAGAVTHTSNGTGTGSGWTEQQSPVNTCELSCFTKTGAGNDYLSLSHNASNYPMRWVWYEFHVGSTYTNSSSETANDDTPPALGSLPGTPQVVICAYCVGLNINTQSDSATVSGSWVEDSDAYAADDGTTDGVYLYTFHQINVTAASITPTLTVSQVGTGFPNDRQKIVIAINAATGSVTRTDQFFAMF